MLRGWGQEILRLGTHSDIGFGVLGQNLLKIVCKASLRPYSAVIVVFIGGLIIGGVVNHKGIKIVPDLELLLWNLDRVKQRIHTFRHRLLIMKYQEQIVYTIAAFATIYFGGMNEYDDTKNRYRGFLASMLFICMIGSLRSYDGPLKKGQHFWRFYFWLGVTYNAFLVFMAFQNEKEARQLMKLGDVTLGKPVTKEMHTYDDNCEFEWINLWDNLDHYFLLHCLNWFLLAFLLRDAFLLNFWQLFDEIIELSWQHILPHFRECWWDHVFLDVLIGNTAFIFLGLWISRKLGIEQFDWLGREGRSFTQWKMWHDHRYFGAVVGTWGAVTVNFLTGFFLMNQLWVPPKCWMVTYRLIVWFGMGVLSWQENWNELNGVKGQSGQCRFLVMWTLFIETFISVKFLKDAGNIQYVPTPGYILYPWIGTIVVCFFWWLKMRLQGKVVLQESNSAAKEVKQKEKKKVKQQ